MKNYLILLILLSLFSNFKLDKTGPWIENKKNNILLYTRPANYSNSPSPDSMDITKILNSQTKNYEEINSFLKVNSNFQVKIYLYNHDEAKEKIGTNTGGGAKAMLKEIYFTFDTTLLHQSDDFMGNHELAHIIASNALGYPATLLMNEGYANALSKGYAGFPLVSYIKYRVDKGDILSPNELLKAKRNQYEENIFHPQSGYFVNWLIENYGIENINKLYPLEANQIKEKIFQLTGKEFDEIEKDYLKYLEKFK